MAETKLYNQVFQYLRDNQYPEGWTKDQKRNLRKKAKTFFLDDSALFFVANENSEPKRRVHDKKEQERILHAYHSWDKLVCVSSNRYRPRWSPPWNVARKQVPDKLHLLFQ